MRNIEEIIVNKTAVCILDRENDKVVFPSSELELTEEAYTYFEKHILKCLRDEDSKPAKFDGERNILKELCKEIFEENDAFMVNTKKIAQYLYQCMKNDEKETSGDVAVCRFESQDGVFLAILKLSFNEIYCHHIKEEQSGLNVCIGISRTGLPNISQKVSKCLLIKEIKEDNDYDLLVCDRDRDGYFIQAFAKCGFIRDSRENTKILYKASENFARKAFKDNAQEAEGFRNRMTDFLKQEDRFDVEKMAEASFSDITTKNEYKAYVLNEGIEENEVTIDREWAEKKLKRKRLKVDKSIELYIDTEAYNDKDKFQIKRNGDGTIDIILKNIRNYIER